MKEIEKRAVTVRDAGLVQGLTIVKNTQREADLESIVGEILVNADMTLEIATEIVVIVIGIEIVAVEIVDQEEMTIVARTVMKVQNQLAVRPQRKGVL